MQECALAWHCQLTSALYSAPKRDAYIFSFPSSDCSSVSHFGTCWKIFPISSSILRDDGGSVVAMAFFRSGLTDIWLWLRSWKDLLMTRGLSSHDGFSFLSLEQPPCSGWKRETSEQDSRFRISACTESGRTASRFNVLLARLPMLMARPMLNPFTESVWRLRLRNDARSARRQNWFG